MTAKEHRGMAYRCVGVGTQVYAVEIRKPPKEGQTRSRWESIGYVLRERTKWIATDNPDNRHDTPVIRPMGSKGGATLALIDHYAEGLEPEESTPDEDHSKPVEPVAESAPFDFAYPVRHRNYPHEEAALVSISRLPEGWKITACGPYGMIAGSVSDFEQEANGYAAEIARLLELGDQRLMATDGPCGGQNAATALDASESARLYKAACKLAGRASDVE